MKTFLIGLILSAFIVALSYAEGESKIDEVNGFPNPATFLHQYVTLRRPLLIRAAHSSPANQKWTDSYLEEKFGSLLVAFQADATNHTHHFGDSFLASTVSLSDFFKGSSDKGVTANSAILSQIPTAMTSDVVVPKNLDCPPFDHALLEADLWITSKTNGDGDSFTYSSLRDYPNTLSCQIRHSRTWALIESTPFRQTDEHQEMPELPENVFTADPAHWPLLAQLPKLTFETKPGDCVYLPGGYFYQTNRTESATERSVSINLVMSGPTSTFGDVSLGEVNENVCNTKKDIPLSEADVAWTYDGTGLDAMTAGWDDPVLIRNLWADVIKRNEGGSMNLEQFTQAIEAEVKELASNSTYDELKKETVHTAVEKFYKVLAGDKGKITPTDVEQCSRKQVIEGFRGYFKLLHIYYSHIINYSAYDMPEDDFNFEDDYDEDMSHDEGEYEGAEGAEATEDAEHGENFGEDPFQEDILSHASADVDDSVAEAPVDDASAEATAEL